MIFIIFFISSEKIKGVIPKLGLIPLSGSNSLFTNYPINRLGAIENVKEESSDKNGS
jgi:hypothetical protein